MQDPRSGGIQSLCHARKGAELLDGYVPSAGSPDRRLGLGPVGITKGVLDRWASGSEWLGSQGSLSAEVGPARQSSALGHAPLAAAPFPITRYLPGPAVHAPPVGRTGLVSVYRQETKSISPNLLRRVERSRSVARMDPLEPGILRDERISDVFYFFEALTTLASGRTVGRKIGVVQETLLRWYLQDDEILRRRMFLEQQLKGMSGARHKVEFSWFAISPHDGLAQGDEIPGTQGLTIVTTDPVLERVQINGPWSGRGIWITATYPTPRNGPLREHLDTHDLDIRVRKADDDINIDVVDRSRLLASLESKRVGAQRFSASEKLGSGIQTIEKAKQASLVAIDVDLLHNGSVKPLEGPNQKTTISVVALGNGVHWTPKDRAVLRTYVDFTYLVKDEAVIRYAQFVQDLCGEDEDFLEFFKAYFQGMTKQERDEFQVTDNDFEIIEPSTEGRSLRQVLTDHMTAVNP